VLDHLEAGQRAHVDRAMAELVGLAAATGDPVMRWRSCQLAAMLAFASGRPDAAERCMTEGFVHGAQADENGRWVVRTVQATLLSLETDDDPTPTVDFLAANVDEFVYPPIRAGAVHALAREGRVDVAAPYVSELVKDVVADTDREASWLLTGSMTADAVAILQDVELARSLLPVMLPFAERIAVDGIGFHCGGCLARPLAHLATLIGDDDLAHDLRTTALERDTAAGLRLWALNDAIDDLAARAAGGPIHQTEVRMRASVLAHEAADLGLVYTARRARALPRPASEVTLTERQRRVLAALADGLTYQAASEHLGFSHSTIRHEAMRIYAALGAADRDDAVRLARRAGLLPG
jgi:DNA-binding CsgD family transcriptional regulator